MIIFQSEVYDDNDFEAEIEKVWDKISSYDPKLYGYDWAETDAPIFQFIPLGYRDYIEGYPIKTH